MATGRWERPGMTSEGTMIQGAHFTSPVGKHSSKSDSKFKTKVCDQRSPSSPYPSTHTTTACNNSKTNRHYTTSPRGSNNGGQRVSNQRRRKPQLTTYDSDITGIEKELSFGEKKKSSPISLNHLLNFTLTPRDRNDATNGTSGSSPNYRRVRRYSNYNKEQFLQANCQFIVREGKTDYTVHSIDPDLLVEWDCIEQLRLFCQDVPSCPICLYPPSAAKMTRCGHIYCSSCVLHYLSLSEKKWAKCPICYESIYKKDLKSVCTVSSKSYNDSDVITMRLMMRHQTSTIVLPRTEWTDERKTATLLPLNGKYDDVCKFAKLLSVSPCQIKEEILDNERKVLEDQLKSLSNEEESERAFIEIALQDVMSRETALFNEEEKEEKSVIGGSNSEATPTFKTSVSGCSQSVFPFDDGDSLKKIDDSKCVLSPGSNQSPSSAPCVTSSSEEEGEGRDEESFGSISRWNTSEYVYFYQSVDGQNIYLHSINTKCLLKEYGGWENCPDAITARIIETEHYAMTESERSHYKYLSHLPITCSFALCELELKSPLVSLTTLDLFADKLQRRKNIRQRKKREEKRREKKYDREGKGVGESFIDLPSNPANYSPEDFHHFLSMASSPPLPSLLKQSHPQPHPQQQETHSSTTPLKSHPSFAQALASPIDKKTPPNKMAAQPKVPQWPNINNRGVVISQSLNKEGDEEDDEDKSVPSFQNAFSDALLTAATESVKAATRNQGGKPGGSKTAKKGRKKLVLFSTGGQRNSQL